MRSKTFCRMAESPIYDRAQAPRGSHVIRIDSNTLCLRSPRAICQPGHSCVCMCVADQVQMDERGWGLRGGMRHISRQVRSVCLFVTTLSRFDTETICKDCIARTLCVFCVWLNRRTKGRKWGAKNERTFLYLLIGWWSLNFKVESDAQTNATGLKGVFCSWL